jgi:hypothetical protein
MTAGVRPLAFAALGLAMGLAACGGGGAKRQASTARTQTTTTTAPRTTRLPRPPGVHDADRRAVRVIRGWVDAERRSDLARAAAYFALPAVVANAGPPLLLRTRAAVRLWNASLPCGARLLEAVAFRGYTIARFRLTTRPGQRCDSTGGTASTAFKLRGGRIAQWVRVDDANPFQGAPRRAPPNSAVPAA